MVFYINAKEQQLTLDDLIGDGEKDTKVFVKEARMLLDSYPSLANKITDDMLRKWSKYGVNLLENVLNEVKDRKIDSPNAYIQTVLEAKYNQLLEMRSNISSDSDAVVSIVSSFIESQASSEVVPEWFIQKKFVDYMKEEYTKEEIDKIWNENKVFIMEKRYTGTK